MYLQMKDTNKFVLHLTFYLFLVTSVSHRPQTSKEISRFGMHVTIDSKQLVIPQCCK